MELAQAPGIVGLRRKSLYTAADDRRAMRLAMRAAQGINVDLPVIYGNRIIGRTLGIGNEMYAITGLDQMINAQTVAGQSLTQPFGKYQNNLNLSVQVWYDHFTVGPDGATYSGAANTSRQFDDTAAGALNHGGNVSPLIKLVTGGFALSPLCAGVWLLYDRVLDYEACTITGVLQNMTNSLPAQRYIAAGEPALQIMVGLQTPIGGGSNLSALVYVDQNGSAQSIPTGTALALDTTAATTPSTVDPTQTAARWGTTAGGSVLYLPLAVGNSGARSITSFTTSAAQTGTLCFTLARPLAVLPVAAANQGGESDWMRQTVMLARIFDGASLYWVVKPSLNQSSFFSGMLNFTWA